MISSLKNHLYVKNMVKQLLTSIHKKKHLPAEIAFYFCDFLIWTRNKII